MQYAFILPRAGEDTKQSEEGSNTRGMHFLLKNKRDRKASVKAALVDREYHMIANRNACRGSEAPLALHTANNSCAQECSINIGKPHLEKPRRYSEKAWMPISVLATRNMRHRNARRKMHTAEMGDARRTRTMWCTGTSATSESISGVLVDSSAACLPRTEKAQRRHNIMATGFAHTDKDSENSAYHFYHAEYWESSSPQECERGE